MYYYVLKLYIYETDIFFIMVFSDATDESSIITTSVIYAQMYEQQLRINCLSVMGNAQWYYKL